MKHTRMHGNGVLAGALLLLAACSHATTAPEYGDPRNMVQPNGAVTVVVHNDMNDPIAMKIELNGEKTMDGTIEAKATNTFNMITKALAYGNPVMLVVTWTTTEGTGTSDPLLLYPGSTVQLFVSSDGMSVGPTQGGHGGKW